MTSRLVLAVDTSTEVLAIGLGYRRGMDVEPVRSLAIESPRRANAELLPRVAAELKDLGLSVSEIAEVVVGLGPGSFTGVRIGVATAKGVAHGLGVPLHGVGTLDAVAWRVLASRAVSPGALVMVLGDAMRGEVYPALFRVSGDATGIVRLTADRVAKPADVISEWAVSLGERAYVAGNGLAKYAGEFEAGLGERLACVPRDLWAPDGASLLAAYADARARGAAGDGEPALVLPIYTRLSDAEETERARAAAGGSAAGDAAVPATGVVGPDAAGAPRSSSITLRPMTPADLLEVLAIERASFSDAWTEGMFAEDLEAPGRAWIVAVDEGRIVGYGGVAVLVDEAHIMNLAVGEERRGEGIGRALFARLKSEALDRDAQLITLEVRETNTVATALYESEGLSVAGMRRGYYADTGENALIMWGPASQTPGQASEHDAGCELSEPVAGASGDLILAIESSCDESAAAVLLGGREVLSSVVASQVDFHARFGGVVPEIASRKHTEAIVGVVEEAMRRAGERLSCRGTLPFSALDAIAVTQAPGLIGALVVGLAYAKGLSLATGLPLVGVNHLEGHIFANVLADPEVAPPLVALVVSGGHTSLVHMPEWGVYRTLGETLDDAAGEAFDKVAKVLGLGYPGGPVLSGLAAEGNPRAIDFPRAMMRSGDYAFSLSGLKTAVINYIRHEREAGREIDLPDLAASFQAAIIDVQVAKSVRAVEETGATAFCLAGGVAANPALREALRAAIEPLGVYVSVPPMQLCTDNAAMIAAAGQYRFERGETLGLDAEASASAPLDTVSSGYNS